MPAHLLENYLKTYRKRSGLFQREVASLLGWKCAEQFACYERQGRLPSLRVALALAAIFRVPVTELFAGVNDSVTRETESRIRALTSELQKKTGQGKEARRATRKLSWLAEHHGNPSSSNK